MLNKLLNEKIQATPNKTAIVYGSNKISYAMLGEKINILTLALRKQGVGPSDKILIMLPNSPELVISFFAAAKIGARLMMLDPASTQTEISNYMTSFAPDILLTDHQRKLACCRMAVRCAKKMKVVTIEKLSSKNQDWSIENDVERNQPISDNFLYAFSSGSTGSAKTIIYTQKGMCYTAVLNSLTMKVTKKDRFLSLIPLYFAHGINLSLLTALGSGATLVLFNQFLHNSVSRAPLILQRRKIVRLIEKKRVTVLSAVPYTYQLLSEMPVKLIGDVSSLRLCLSSGSDLLPNVFDAFLLRFNQPIRHTYGTVETGMISVNMDDDFDVIRSSVGLPAKGVEVKIVDNEEREIPLGMIGRVWVRSKKMAAGYVDQPYLNAEVFRDGWFVTEDLGKKDNEGRLYLEGRISDWIEINGYKIDPKEVERVLLAHPIIKEAVVLGAEMLRQETVIKAVIVTKGQVQLTEEEIKRYCGIKLSSYKVPQVIEFRDSLPRINALRKIDKQRLMSL